MMEFSVTADMQVLAQTNVPISMTFLFPSFHSVGGNCGLRKTFDTFLGSCALLCRLFLYALGILACTAHRPFVRLPISHSRCDTYLSDELIGRSGGLPKGTRWTASGSCKYSRWQLRNNFLILYKYLSCC